MVQTISTALGVILAASLLMPVLAAIVRFTYWILGKELPWRED